MVPSVPQITHNQLNMKGSATVRAQDLYKQADNDYRPSGSKVYGGGEGEGTQTGKKKRELFSLRKGMSGIVEEGREHS